MRGNCNRDGPRLGCPTAVVFEGATSYNDLEDLPTLDGVPIKGEMSGRMVGASGGGTLSDDELDGILGGGAAPADAGYGGLTDDEVDDIVNGGAGGPSGPSPDPSPEGALSDDELLDILNG